MREQKLIEASDWRMNWGSPQPWLIIMAGSASVAIMSGVLVLFFDPLTRQVLQYFSFPTSGLYVFSFSTVLFWLPSYLITLCALKRRCQSIGYPSERSKLREGVSTRDFGVSLVWFCFVLFLSGALFKLLWGYNNLDNFAGYLFLYTMLLSDYSIAFIIKR